MGAFVREKKIHCGKNHMEVDIYQITDNHLRKRIAGREKKSQHHHRRISMTKMHAGISDNWQKQILPARIFM